MGINLKTVANQMAYLWEQVTVTGVSFTATSTSHTIVYSWYVSCSGDIQTTAGTGGYMDVQIFGKLLNNNGQTIGTSQWYTCWTLNAKADGSYTYGSFGQFCSVSYTYTGLTIGSTYKFCTGLYGELYFPSNGVSKTADLGVSSTGTYLYYERN